VGNSELKEASVGEVATAIRVALARKNSTQSALASHLNLSQPAIARRMTGKVSWRISELASVAEFFGVTVSELLAAEKASA
jgi:transcriptional regulator with XRE-family HTH domain